LISDVGEVSRFSAYGLKVGRAARQKILRTAMRFNSAWRFGTPMDELSIAPSLVDAFCDELPQLGNVSIRSIHLN
jgi:hypothetical protein